MVATRDKIDYLTGNKKVKKSSLTASEWELLIRTIVNELDLKRMRGFQHLRDILPKSKNFNAVRERTSALPQLWTGKPGSGNSMEVSESCVFLLLVQEDVLPRTLDAATRETKEPQVQVIRFLLLSRAGKFFELKTTWIPECEWEGSGAFRYIRSFQYVLSCNAKKDLDIQVLEDGKLVRWFNPKNINICTDPNSLLLTFSLCCVNQLTGAERAYLNAVKQKQFIDDVLDRIDEF